MNLHQVIVWVGFWLPIICVGCSSDRPMTVPVSGQITFDGGPCPADGTIVFSPVAVEESMPRRPGTAPFLQDGAFAVTSFRDGDGLIPGRYRPIVSCWMGEPHHDDPGSYERLNYVPGSYKPDEIVVGRSDGEVKVKLNVPKKK